MIRLIDINGLTHYLAPQSIASIIEAGTSSQWHGIRAYVRTTNGKTIEARETADQIATMIAAGAEKLIALQAEIDAHEMANSNLFALVNELRALLQDEGYADIVARNDLAGIARVAGGRKGAAAPTGTSR